MFDSVIQYRQPLWQVPFIRFQEFRGCLNNIYIYNPIESMGRTVYLPMNCSHIKSTIHGSVYGPWQAVTPMYTVSPSSPSTFPQADVLTCHFCLCFVDSFGGDSD